MTVKLVIGQAVALAIGPANMAAVRIPAAGMGENNNGQKE